ncbi:MAG TPA: anti-sigma factor [Gammaproteobacteria bacterium]|nr:anti-sigma factor [Gammaproteobacteria bacterium]
MRCKEAETLIEAYVDRELSAAQSATVMEHLACCESCQRRYQALIGLRSALQQHCQVVSPAGLRRDIEKQLRQSSSPGLVHSAFQFMTSRWMPYTALIFLGMLIGWQSTLHLSNDTDIDQTQNAIISAHIDSLLVDHMTDIPSGDSHTVKPWFTGKLDFAPPVLQFADEEFFLVGGRLEYIQERLTAALVYRRRQHILNLFIWPAAGSQPIRQVSIRGYNLVRWRINGLQYYLVSDLNSRELNHFGAVFYARCQMQTVSP